MNKLKKYFLQLNVETIKLIMFILSYFKPLPTFIQKEKSFWSSLAYKLVEILQFRIIYSFIINIKKTKKICYPDCCISPEFWRKQKNYVMFSNIKSQVEQCNYLK